MCDDLIQMSWKFLSFLGLGRSSTQADEALVQATRLEDLDVGTLRDCSICMERMGEPKFLPCHHTFCRGCIEQLCQAQSEGAVPCPLCRSPFLPPTSGDFASLPTNVYVEEFASRMQEASKAQGELAAAKNRLKACEDEKRQAVGETARLKKELYRTTAKLTKRKDLAQHIDDLKRRMSTAELAGFCPRARENELRLQDALQQLKRMESLNEEANSKADIARMEVEENLRAANESSCSLGEKLKQLKMELEESKQETEDLKNQLAAELENSKKVVSSLNHHREGLKALLIVAAVVLVLFFVANFAVSTIRFDSLCESIRIDSFCKKIGLSIH